MDVAAGSAPWEAAGCAAAGEVQALREQVAQLQAELDALRRARARCVVLSVVVGGHVERDAAAPAAGTQAEELEEGEIGA